MISHKLEVIFNMAIKMANQRKHEYLTMETLLLALLDDEVVTECLSLCGANLPKLKTQLTEFIDDQENFAILSDEDILEISQEQFVNEELRQMAQESGITYQPEVSIALQRVIQRAAIHIQSSGKQHIRGINLLVAMFGEEDSFALYLLEDQNISKTEIVQVIAHGIDQAVNIGEESLEQLDIDPDGQSEQTDAEVIEEFATNLNKRAAAGKIDPLIGRESEVKRIVQILCRRRKNNPLLVGDAGVGKTAIAEGLAAAINDKRVPEVLSNATIFSLDMASLLAGTKYRGDFEQRFKKVMKSLEKIEEKGGHPILFIDEIHTIIGAGSTNAGGMDVSNLIKPALSGGNIRCMGSTTFDEYRKFIEKDTALSRRFQKLDVFEPNEEDCIKILDGLRPQFEQHHQVKYSKPVIKAAVKLSNKFITDRKLPDKAIDVIDEIGALLQLNPPNKKRSKVTVADVENIISLMAKVPKQTVSSSEKEKIANLEDHLKLLIYGQDQAVEKVVNAIMLSRSGLGKSEGPTASFLFAGPTGVGKTELAKQLAYNLGIHFSRFDMSEYMEKHAVSKLIGAPPGYVGYDEGGLLTDEVNKNPHCVLLLDEIEKAHPDIFNILLQVMDHGKLSDSNGRETVFNNVLLIMTTNAGAKEMDNGLIGLGGKIEGANSHKRDKVIKNFFTPEFRNRLDDIIHFNKLNDKSMLRVVDKFLHQLSEQLSEKKVVLNVEMSARVYLAEQGQDEKLGARPIARFIDEKIKKQLAKEVLFGNLTDGGKVNIDYKEDELKFSYE